MTAYAQGFFKEKAEYSFQFDQGDGIFGMSIGSRTKETPGFMEVSGLDKFNLYLTDGKIQSEFSIGDPDATKFHGALIYEPLTHSEYYWEVNMQAVSVGSIRVDLPASQTIVDSGTPFIILSLDDSTRINTAIGAKLNSTMQVFTIDCELAKTAPPIAFQLSNGIYSVPSHVYISRQGNLCISHIGWFGANDPSGQRNILGVTFLRAMYSHWDREGKRIGFAPAVY